MHNFQPISRRISETVDLVSCILYTKATARLYL